MRHSPQSLAELQARVRAAVMPLYDAEQRIADPVHVFDLLDEGVVPWRLVLSRHRCHHSRCDYLWHVYVSAVCQVDLEPADYWCIAQDMLWQLLARYPGPPASVIVVGDRLAVTFDPPCVQDWLRSRLPQPSIN